MELKAFCVIQEGKSPIRVIVRIQGEAHHEPCDLRNWGNLLSKCSCMRGILLLDLKIILDRNRRVLLTYHTGYQIKILAANIEQKFANICTRTVCCLPCVYFSYF